MSIDNQIANITSQLSRIADALEKLIGIGTPAPTPVPPPTPGPVPNPTAPPTPMPTMPPAPGTPLPVAGPHPVMPGPAAIPTPTPGATLDDIRAVANDFHRAHPDRATQVMTILTEKGVQKMDQLAPQFFQEVYDRIKALGA